MNTFEKAKEIFSQLSKKFENEIFDYQIVADIPGMFEANVRFLNNRNISITAVKSDHNFESKVIFWESDGNTKLIECSINKFDLKDFDCNSQYSVTYKKIKKELGLNDSDIAGFFDMTLNSYANSSAKKRYQNALCKLYMVIKAGGKK
jgi:hypothetical protein